MSLKSKRQARFMFSQHPGMAKEWADKTPSIKTLPEKVKQSRYEGLFDELIKIARGPTSAIINMSVGPDYEGIVRMLEDIKHSANIGHSFGVIVDPEEKGGRKYSIDGDGAAHINEIEVHKVKSSGVKDKIVGKLVKPFADAARGAATEGATGAVKKYAPWIVGASTMGGTLGGGIAGRASRRKIPEPKEWDTSQGPAKNVVAS